MLCMPARRAHEVEEELDQVAVMTAIGERPRATRGGSRLDVKALVVFFARGYATCWRGSLGGGFPYAGGWRP